MDLKRRMFSVMAISVGKRSMDRAQRHREDMAQRQLAMVSGRIQAELTADELRNDPTLQRQYLGVDA